MADQLAAHGADPHQGDEVAEGHRSAEELDRDDVAEERQDIVHPLEPSPRPGVGVGQLGRGHRPGIDERRRTYWHGTVREDGDRVERQADAQDPHPGDVPVHEHEAGEDRERHAEHQALRRSAEQPDRRLQRDPDHHDRRTDDDRRPQMPPVRSPQCTDSGTDRTGEENGDHLGDGTSAGCVRR